MKLFLVINFVTFQLCWFIAATYQSSGIPVIVLLLGIHFLFSPNKKADIEILPMALVGIVVDQLLISLQIIQLPQGTESPLIIPIWLMLLWCSFAWCFNHSLKWLTQLSFIKVGAIGAVFGTLSYFIALQLNVFSSSLPPLYFISVLALVWVFLLPFLTRMHHFIVK